MIPLARRSPTVVMSLPAASSKGPVLPERAYASQRKYVQAEPVVLSAEQASALLQAWVFRQPSCMGVGVAFGLHMKMLLLECISSPCHSPFPAPERASHTPCCPGGGAGGHPAGHAPRQAAVESPGPTTAAAQLVHRVLAVQCLLPRSSGGGATDSR